MSRARNRRLPLVRALALLGIVGLWAVACGGPQPLAGSGAVCFRADECQAGLACIPETPGAAKHVCSDNLTGIISMVDGAAPDGDCRKRWAVARARPPRALRHRRGPRRAPALRASRQRVARQAPLELEPPRARQPVAQRARARRPGARRPLAPRRAEQPPLAPRRAAAAQRAAVPPMAARRRAAAADARAPTLTASRRTSRGCASGRAASLADRRTALRPSATHRPCLCRTSLARLAPGRRKQ